MTSRSWGPPKGWALASALLHAATLSLLFSGWRELSALSELRHPSHQSSSMSASPGRRLQVSVRDRRANWARWSCRTAACTLAQPPGRRCGRRKPADRADPLVVAGRLLPRSVAAARPPQHGTHASSCAHRDRLAPPHGPTQALGEPGGPSPLRSSGGGSPPRTARPTPASQVVGGLEQAGPGGAGGARPASAAFGEELPINHLANDPAYVAGSGALTDPLSCL